MINIFTLNTVSLYGVVLAGGAETKTLSEEFEHNLHTHTNANIGKVTEQDAQLSQMRPRCRLHYSFRQK